MPSRPTLIWILLSLAFASCGKNISPKNLLPKPAREERKLNERTCFQENRYVSLDGISCLDYPKPKLVSGFEKSYLDGDFDRRQADLEEFTRRFFAEHAKESKMTIIPPHIGPPYGISSAWDKTIEFSLSKESYDVTFEVTISVFEEYPQKSKVTPQLSKKGNPRVSFNLDNWKPGRLFFLREDKLLVATFPEMGEYIASLLDFIGRPQTQERALGHEATEVWARMRTLLSEKGLVLNGDGTMIAGRFVFDSPNAREGTLKIEGISSDYFTSRNLEADYPKPEFLKCSDAQCVKDSVFLYSFQGNKMNLGRKVDDSTSYFYGITLGSMESQSLSF